MYVGWKGDGGGVERGTNEDETEGVTHVTHVETPLPPNDNGRVFGQE